VAYADLWNLAIDISRGQSADSNSLGTILPFYRQTRDLLSRHEEWSLSDCASALETILSLLSNFETNPSEASLERLRTHLQSLRSSRADGLMRKADPISNTTTSDMSLSFDSIWIVKPAALSCGREISVVTGLRQLLSQVSAMDFHCVAQKYIERPLLVRKKRKFDIRQWVLVTSVNPLVIYGFSECYLRLSGREFDLQATDSFTHLCNHSIQKADLRLLKEGESPGEEESEVRAESEAGVAGLCDTMMTLQEFKDFLRTTDSSTDLFQTKILPQIRETSIESVLCCRERLEKVGKGFEWLGLDLMVTEDLEVALLEVNVSPDTTLSTPVTSRLVGPATEDLFTLILEEQVASGTGPAMDAVHSYYECHLRQSRPSLGPLDLLETRLAARWPNEGVSGRGVMEIVSTFPSSSGSSPSPSSASSFSDTGLLWQLWYVGLQETSRDLRELSQRKKEALGVLREKSSSSNSSDLTQREYRSLVDQILSIDLSLQVDEEEQDEI
jgi:hypothetical protein